MAEPHEFDSFAATPPPSLVEYWRSSPFLVSAQGWEVLSASTSWRFLTVHTISEYLGQTTTTMTTAQDAFGFGVGVAYSYGEVFDRQHDTHANIGQALKRMPAKIYADTIATQLHYYMKLVHEASASNGCESLEIEAPHLVNVFEHDTLRELGFDEEDNLFLARVYRVGAAAGHALVRDALKIAASHQQPKSDLERVVADFGGEEAAGSLLVEQIISHLLE